MSAQGFTRQHWSDEKGNPAGGCTTGRGFTISWQHGPLGSGPDRKVPNGAFVEDIIAAARDRIEHYQATAFACPENAHAIECLTAALQYLEQRTSRRTEEGTEGTHMVTQAEGKADA